MIDTKKQAGNLFVHYCKVAQGTLRTNSDLTLHVYHCARTATRANHSATHLLHEALREVLGDRNDVRVEGDRFVFQSEVLFDSGSANLVGAGRGQISTLANTLKQIADRIPKDIDWVLRVDGHTDRIPIHNARYPSNWELSTARAVAVVKLLIEDGLPPHRLAATGFGEFRPLDAGDSPASLRRNRRIEFKLTGR